MFNMDWFDYDDDLKWRKVGHSGPEETAYIKQGVG